MGHPQVENARLKLVTACAIVCTVVALVWQAAGFKTEVTSELKSIGSSLNAISSKLEKNGDDVTELSKKLTDLQMTGSVPVKSLQDRVGKLEQAVQELQRADLEEAARLREHEIRSSAAHPKTSSLTTNIYNYPTGGKGDHEWTQN